jgi:N-acetylmuramoyl-L-alanine amidase
MFGKGDPVLRVLLMVLAILGSVGSAVAQAPEPTLSALARLVPQAQGVRVLPDGNLQLDLGLSQAVAWRMRERADPPRLVLDFRELDFTGLDRAAMIAASGGRFVDMRAGALAEGWSRLVIELDAPFAVAQAGLRTGLGDSAQEARLTLRIGADTAGDFAARAAQPDPPTWALTPPSRPGLAAPPRRKGGPVVVVLDPGHGGIDPGAERGGVTEAALMLTFARELKEALLRAGGFEVVLTREGDVFVPLESRIAFADAAGADVFVSLHADAIAEGIATGAAVYTMDETATDAASAALAERHDRDTMMAGADLSGQDDQVAGVLMDLARLETTPRSRHLAQELLLAMAGRDITMHRVPQRQAAFSVLKLPHVPSVLVELGYLSSERDLKRLTDPKWRDRMAAAMVAGLQEWALRDAALADLRRQ